MRIQRLRPFLALAAFACLALPACGGDDDDGKPDAADAIGDVPAEEAPEVVSETGAETVTDAVTDTLAPIDWDAFFAPRGWTDDGKKRVVLLHTNDLHSHLDGLGPLADFSPDALDSDGTLGGLARLAALVEKERRDPRPGAAVLAVDGGDFTFGSAFSALSRNLGIELKLMDAMGFLGTTLGNHEMDWTPNGTAMVVDAGIGTGDGLKVLASNLVIPDDKAAADLKALVGTKILPWRVVTLDNGLKVGLFGLLGTGAWKLSPHAAPVTVRPLAEAANEAITALKAEGVDLIVALSHSGVTEGDGPTGEDETLAGAVEGIDVIVSGHTHTLLPQPTVVGKTLIVQAGCYGQYLGRLTLVKGADGFELESWDTLPIDDATPGLPDITTLIEAAEAHLDTTMFAGSDYGYQTPVATTGFDMMPLQFAESNLGDFVADAVRWTTSKYDPEGPVEVVFEANGVIRDGIPMGRTGEVRVGDLVRVLPLGIGPDEALGYPMLAFYLSAAELAQAAEVIVGLAPIVADSFWLQVSGLKFEFDPNGDLLFMVNNIWLGDEVDGYSAQPLDYSAANTRLYRVAANLYIAQMLGVLEDQTGGMVAIDIKDKDGNVIANPEDAIIDIDPDTAGVQELKLWRTMIEYAASFPVDSATGLPKIPDRYATSLQRLKAAP